MKRILAWTSLAFVAAQGAAILLGSKAVMLLALGAIAAFWLLRRQTIRASFCLILAVSVFLGAGWNLIYTQNHVSAAEKLDGKTVTALAEVRTTAPAYGNFAYGVLRLSEIDGKTESVLVNCYGFPNLKPGQYFRADFELMQVDKSNLERYSEGIFLEAEYRGNFTPESPVFGIMASFSRLRMKLSSGFEQWMPPEESALAGAIVLGDKSRLTAELRKTFADAGASHMLVVSGMHLSMMCGVFIGLFHLGMVSRKRILLTLLIGAMMSGLVGFTVSIVRAGTLLVLSCIGLLFYRRPDSITSLSFSALLITLHCPYALFDVGFQLTFSATAGVILAAKLHGHLISAEIVTEEETKKSTAKRIADSVGAAALSGLFAALFTMPFLLWHRMAVSGSGVISSLVAMVWMPLILGLGGITAILSLTPFLPILRFLSLLLTLLLRIQLTLLHLLGNLPFSRISLPREYTVFAAAAIAAGVLLVVKWGHPRAAAALAAWSVFLAVLFGMIHGRNVVEFELFGDRNAPCLLAVQNGESLLVFRGGIANRTRLQQVLDYRGLWEADTVIDLRQSRISEPPQGKTIILARDLDEAASGSAARNLSYCIVNDKDGTLVLLDAGGFRVAMTAGELEGNRSVPAHVYLAAGKKDFQVDPDKVVVIHTGYSWIPDTEETIYWGEHPVISVRPGKSVQYKGVKPLVLQ